MAATTSTTTSIPTTTSTPTTTTSTPTTTTSTTIEDARTDIDVEVRGDDILIEVDGDEVAGRRVSVPQGDEVRLRVEADVSDHVHVHTYDLFADVTPEQPAGIEFVADIPGIHEVELEDSHRLLFELEVAP